MFVLNFRNFVIYEKGDIVSFGACGLPYFVGDFFEDTERMIARTPEAFIKSGVDVKTLGDLKNLLKKLKPEIVEAAEPVFNETVSKSSDYVKSKVDDELKKL